MSPLGLYGALALLLLASAGVGWAVLVMAGRRNWSWTAPALGLAVLVVIGLAAQLPGRGVTASVLAAAAVAASVAVLVLRQPERPPGVASWMPIVGLTVLMASVPFAAGGGFDLMGTYVNNDIAFHLYNAEWLRTHEGVAPPQVAGGYPLGPHGSVVALSTLTGAGLPEAWTALLIAAPVVTALASLSVIGRLDWPLRTLGSLLVGLSYLGASFYVQSAFKETLMAVFVLGFALALREAAGEGGAARRNGTAGGTWLPRAGIAPAAFAFAALATYSLPGLAWAAGTLALWVAIRWGRAQWEARRSAAGAAAFSKRRVALSLAVAIALLGALGYVAWDRSAGFIGGRHLAGSGAVGNLFEPIPPTQALGLWLSSDYRLVEVSTLGKGGVFTLALAVLGTVALVLGVMRLAQRRELAVLSALAASAGAWAVASPSLGPYVASKSLAIIAPLVMLAAIVGIAPERAESERAWIARTLVAVAFVAIALGSSYVALSGARLDRDDHEEQLGEFRDEVEGARVLFLGSDELATWALRGAEQIETGTQAFENRGLPRTGERIDFDSFLPGTLDDFDYAIATRSGYMSQPPRTFHPVARTESFTLYERTGPMPFRGTLEEGQLFGAVLDCDSALGRQISRIDGTAYVVPQVPLVRAYSDAVIGGTLEWVNEGQAITKSLPLPRGRWQLSLQYHSLEPVDVEASGLLRVELPPNSSRIGPYWPVGTFTVGRARTVDVTVVPQVRSGVRGLLSLERGRTGPQTILGLLVATQVGTRRDAVPLSEACGRIVDYVELDEPRP
jgi:hypothetical protein